MPITIDGSGSITGLSAGGLPDLSVTTDEIAAAAVTAPKLSSAQSGSAPIYAARAWVNFNGTGTVAIRASGNVSSITDHGVGLYTLNYTTAMPNANYALAGAVQYDTVTGRSPRAFHVLAYNTGSTQINTVSTASSEDLPYINVSVFG
jgi:hypothetical protein